MGIFDIDIKKLYGVGDVRASKYRTLGIQSVGDLLCHYPRGYEDRGNIKLLGDTDGSEKCAYLLTVATQPKSARIKGRMTLTKFRAYDDSASCEITFFNQDYLKNTFLPGMTFRFYGRAEYKNGKYSLVSPVFEAWSEQNELPNLVPVYPLTNGLSQKQIAKDMNTAFVLLAAKGGEADPLPEDIRRKNKLCLYSYALKNIHNPESFSALAAAKKRLIFDEFFNFALGLTLQASKQRRAEAHPCTNSDITPLVSCLPYTLTDAQKRVIEEIKADMKKNTAMSRMVVGDVGSGKTVCAAAAMLFAVQSGHQAALMAPTEILARQHYESLLDIFNALGLKSALLLGATSPAEKKKIHARLSSHGEDRIDVVVGTQALLSAGVEFASLGLAVVDEQHRFGVNQRSVLSQKNSMSHLLVMSATPIPRSLALALHGELDISTIDQIPPGRQVVDTFVVDESYRDRLCGFIKKQVNEGGQVYVVCPSVEESEESLDEEEQANLLLSSISVANDILKLNGEQASKPKLKSAVQFSKELSERLPDLSIDFLHGRLKSSEKEEKMRRFADGETDVLVSTTVIEVGVNVPSASLMIVENAERFGLSQLHQLRGRVGRGTRKSYCVLVSELINEEYPAKERLLTIKSSHDGYSIAEKDLQMRGPGDFIRTSDEGKMRQSGGVRFKLAELCDDTGLMTAAFTEARSLIEQDRELTEHPLLRARAELMFTGSSGWAS